MARIATILILAMLGHGLLMTSGADGAACPARAAQVAAVVPFLHCFDHDAGRFTVQGVVKSAPLALRWAALAKPCPLTLPSVIPVARTAPPLPGRPPDVARALLQVYRV